MQISSCDCVCIRYSIAWMCEVHLCKVDILHVRHISLKNNEIR